MHRDPPAADFARLIFRPQIVAAEKGIADMNCRVAPATKKRTSIWLRVLVAAAALASQVNVTAAHAQTADPWRAWRTAETGHFRLHYERGQEAVALRVGQIAERAHIVVTAGLQWTPRDKTDIVLYSGIDLANGFATPLPFSHSGIVLTAPNEDELLDRGEWLELVILHEYTHIVHLDKVAGAPGVLRKVFGRIVWTFPNLLQPNWPLEGLAVFNESRAGDGIGRLHSPLFEAQLRDERKRGFMRLAEINAGGRRAPLNRDYLYGSYFFDFLARRYGVDAVATHVNWYSRQILPFRLQNSPLAATGKKMDELWNEFLHDLARQVDQRAAPILALPERVGEAVGPPLWAVSSMSLSENSDLYLAVSDGIHALQLQRWRAGEVEVLTDLDPDARIEARASGAVLLAQPDSCGGHDYLFDLYRWEERTGLRQLTSCRRYLAAVWAGELIVAIGNDRAGATRVDLLDGDGALVRLLLPPEPAMTWLSVTAGEDGTSAVLIGKRNGNFGIYRLDLSSAHLTLLHVDGDRKQDLQVGGDGALYFIASSGNVPNVWRLQDGTLTRITHAHTAVLQLAGAAADGTLAFGVLDDGKVQVRRMLLDAAGERGQPPLDARAALTDSAATTLPPALLPPAREPTQFAFERNYNPLPSLLPHAWWPVAYVDHGSTGIGVSIFGADALGAHAYTLMPIAGVEPRVLLGLAEYSYDDRHFITATRNLTVEHWSGSGNNEKVIDYEVATSAQWVSLARWLAWRRQVALGVGAALARTNFVTVDGPTINEHDQRLAAAVAEYDSRGGGVLAEAPAYGQHLQIFYETYRPFSAQWDGRVVRGKWDGYLPLGPTVLAASLVEGHGQSGNSEPFELGGSFSTYAAAAPTLDERRIVLRGYRAGESALTGANARRGTLEFRVPVADIDRNAMVPPVGINRLSMSAFVEAGGAWDSGHGPHSWYRSAGVELLAELRLGYVFALPLRVGVARGLDTPGETQVYAHIGRSF